MALRQIHRSGIYFLSYISDACDAGRAMINGTEIAAVPGSTITIFHRGDRLSEGRCPVYHAELGNGERQDH